jgi:hypothetical protein
MEALMPNPAIISLAVLKVNWDVSRKDYLENFVPMVAECIRRSPDEVVSLASVQRDLRTSFGLSIPQNAIKTILRRINKRGYVVAENRAYKPNRPKLEELQFQQVQQSVIAKHESLIRSLKSFCLTKFNVDMSDDELENALQSYLEENQLAIIGSSLDGTIMPEPKQSGPKSRFLVGSFVGELQRTGSADLAYLETVVKGVMLASAIFLPDPAQAERKFRNTEVYFDTAFLIFALGYAGEPRRAPCAELLRLLYEVGADLRCFKHTLDEIRGALDACAERLARGQLKDAYGPSIEYFIEKGCSASDVELFTARLERDLKALRVGVVDKPDYVKQFQIDEKELEALLMRRITYRKQRACIRDVDSISAIMRLRRLQEFFIIEECRALFVTTNGELARASREFFYREATQGSVGPALSDHALTSLLWLKRPLEAPDLPKMRIAADCYAATQPDERLWRLYLAEIDRLTKAGQVTADDYYMLRHSLEAKAALMELTLGDDAAFSQGTVPEILDMVRSRLQADLRGQLAETEAKLKSAEAQRIKQIARIREQATKYAARLALAAQSLALILLIAGGFMTFPWKLPSPSTAWGRYLLSFSQIAVGVFSCVNLACGVTVQGVVRKLELALARHIEKQLRKMAGF